MINSNYILNFKINYFKKFLKYKILFKSIKFI